MATKKKKRTTDIPRPEMPTAPTKIPRGRLTAGDKRFVAKQRTSLADARREGVAAASKQLRTIDRNVRTGVNRQGRKLDTESSKVLASMNRMTRTEREYGRRVKRQVGDSTVELSRRTSSTGAGGSWMDQGLTGRRTRQANVQASVSRKITDALRDAGAATARAGERSADAYGKVGASAGKNSMSILDVLAAERKSDDQRFLADMKFQIRQTRQSQQFQLMMQNLGFEQDIYKMELQNSLQAEYLDWQHENGYLLKPEEQAALDWKYRKKELSEAWKQSQKDKDPAAAAKWDAYNTEITDTIVDVNAALSGGKRTDALLKTAAEKVQAGEFTSVQEALTEGLTPSQDQLPQTVDAGVVRNVISDMVANKMAGDMGSESSGGPGWAPNWETTKQYILQGDSDGTMTQYIQRKGKTLEQAHNDYKQIALATHMVNDTRDASLTSDGGFPVGAVAAGAAAVAGAGAAGVVGHQVWTNEGGGAAGLKAGLRQVGKGVAAAAKAPAKGVGVAGRAALGMDFSGINVDLTAADINPRMSKAAAHTIKAAATRGRMSMFSDISVPAAQRVPIEAGPIQYVDEIEAAGQALARGSITAREYGGILQKAGRFAQGLALGLGGPVGDEAMGAIRHADPELYNKITGQINWYDDPTPGELTEGENIGIGA